MWDEAETRALVPFARPEILETDLSGLALDLARWGARDPSELAFLDPPPATAFKEARALLARLMDEAPVIESQGRMFGVETRYLGRDPRVHLEEPVARAVMKALAEESGSLLVFLPGQGEIRRVERLLAERVTRTVSRRVRPLDGSNRGTRARPQSITTRTPWMVRLVSAMEVASTTLRRPGGAGAMARACSAKSRAP